MTTATKSKGRPKKELTTDVTTFDTSKMQLIKEVSPLGFYLNQEDYKIYVSSDKKNYKEILNSDIDEMIKVVSKSNRVILDVENSVKQSNSYLPGDKVLLYGPTGTGKTHQIIQWINDMGITYDMVTVSDGFEDIDFLTHIVPYEGGIQYKEKSIIGLFRRASQGEKVAILIDEVNRGSKSFMNMLLKILDPVTGSYEINNFMQDEVIKIPIDNIIFFCTANLGGAYTGVNDIDEALLDRFNKVSFVDYNEYFEQKLLSNFGDQNSNVKLIVEYIRELFKSNELKRPLSSRSLKSWVEDYLNTAKEVGDIFASFERTVMYRIVGIESFGTPSQQDIGVITSKFIELGILSNTK